VLKDDNTLTNIIPNTINYNGTIDYTKISGNKPATNGGDAAAALGIGTVGLITILGGIGYAFKISESVTDLVDIVKTIPNLPPDIGENLQGVSDGWGLRQMINSALGRGQRYNLSGGTAGARGVYSSVANPIYE